MTQALGVTFSLDCQLSGLSDTNIALQTLSPYFREE